MLNVHKPVLLHFNDCIAHMQTCDLRCLRVIAVDVCDKLNHELS